MAIVKTPEMARTPRFFPVILPRTLESATLELPVSFVSKHGSFLPNHVRIELPTGARWRVAVERRGGRAWLRNGLREFVERCNVEVGCFLVFDYRREEELFHVRVFQRTAVEIEYPSANHAVRLEEPQIMEIADGDTDVDDDDDDSSEGFGEDDDDGLSLGGSDECKISPSGSEDNVLAKVEAFESKKPSSTIHMGRTYISTIGNTQVPKAHSRSYLKEFKQGEKVLHLHHENQRKWVVSYRVLDSSTRSSLVRFGHGWMKFVSDNDLRVGDACVFEMIHENVKEYKVTIFKRVDCV